MNMRCKNPNYPGYIHYGGRGIEICDEWSDFNTFVTDMGYRPAGASLERIDVNGNYSKENCKWATAKEQANNRRNTARVEYKGATYTVLELSEILNINHYTIRNRIKIGAQIDAPIQTKNARAKHHA